MTNAEIVFNARIELMEAGKIGTSGRFYNSYDADGNEKLVPEPEEIHTYQAWASRGYQVKKGEKAIAAFTIWKHVPAKTDDDGNKTKDARMFMKKASFFSQTQVEAKAS